MTRRALALSLLASLVAGLFVPGPAAAERCDESILDCGYAEQDQNLVLPVAVRTVSAMIPVRTDMARAARALYRRLLPAPYAMPAVPAIGVQVSQIDLLDPALAGLPAAPGLPPARWFEASIALKAANGTEEGWFTLAAPVATEFALGLARAAGLPAVPAEISVPGYFNIKTLDAVTGTVHVNGALTMSLQWVEHPYSLAANVEDWARNRDPLFTRSPALTGPAAMRLKYTPKPYVPVFDATGGAPDRILAQPPATALGALRAGVVVYRLDPTIDDLDRSLPDVFPRGTSLATLIRPAGRAVGVYLESSHLLLRQVATLS